MEKAEVMHNTCDMTTLQLLTVLLGVFSLVQQLPANIRRLLCSP